MGAFSRRSLGSVAGPWFLFDANFELTPLEPGPAASSRRGLQWRPRPAGGPLRGRPTPRFRTFTPFPLATTACIVYPPLTALRVHWGISPSVYPRLLKFPRESTLTRARVCVAASAAREFP